MKLITKTFCVCVELNNVSGSRDTKYELIIAEAPTGFPLLMLVQFWWKLLYFLNCSPLYFYNTDLEFKFIINHYGHETLPFLQSKFLNTQNCLYSLHDLHLPSSSSSSSSSGE